MKFLKEKLLQIDGRSYKAYKDIQGTYNGDIFKMHIDYVQPDPFAPPSRIRLEIPKAFAKYQDEWYKTDWRLTAFEDFLTREIAGKIKSSGINRMGTGKSGLVHIDTPGQEILKRTSVKVDNNKLEVRLSIGLPANGRSVLGRAAAEMLTNQIPSIVKEAVLNFNRSALVSQLKLSDQQEFIRRFLEENNFIGFIGNGSILPRESGISNLPMSSKSAVPFQSPPSFEVEIPVPHSHPIKGMAIPQGVSLIVGGGYHGKSTLLKAIERGVYNHISGDGREYVITNANAFKIRAEDGRRIEKVNISPFITNLPFNKDTLTFSTDDASGSTSQAANIMEALEVGCRVLLIDEDTSATNFMIRDARMQKLVSPEKEPITPFIDKVRALYRDYNVSTILVIGGSGDYFDVADRVIMMDNFKPSDVTERAKAISVDIKNPRVYNGSGCFGDITSRIIRKSSLNASAGGREKVDAKGLNTILYGATAIDLSFVEQLVDTSQTRSIADMIRYIADKLSDDTASLSILIDRVFMEIDKKGLEVVSPYYGKHPGDLALPRKLEVAAAINRLRTLHVK